MSVHVIYYKDGAKMMRPILNREDYLSLRDSEANRAAEKRKMVQMNYSCLPNDDGTLKGSTRVSSSVGMDVDTSIDQDAVLAKKDELGLLMLEQSATKGYHIVFRRRKELSQEGNLIWASKLLGVEYDPGAKDITRVFYTPADKLIFLDDDIFIIEEYESVEEVASANSGVVDDVPFDLSDEDSNKFATTYEDVPYYSIVEQLENLMGGVPEHGSRNQFIFSMACFLRYICNDDPKWVADVLPDYGEIQERWWATIKSACNRSQNKSMPKLMKKAIALARQKMEEEQNNVDDQGMPLPPPMPRRLPKLIKLLISRTPKEYQPAVAQAVFPALATHLWKTRFKYIDNVEHEATLMNVLIAGSSAGKNCIADPINYILKDIRERDAIALERERQWKNEVNSKGANKDKNTRPEGLVIQEVDPDMTNAAFVLRLMEADGHFLYTRMNEIEQFDALKTSSKTNSQFQIMCLAFDPNNSYGQTRVGTQSVSGRVCIRFNWNASTTIKRGLKYFKNVLTDGPISRINFCTIPERPIGAEQPIFGTYDAEFEAQLKPYIDNLNAARGLIECPQAFRLAKKLRDENADFSRLSQSRTFEYFSFRGNLIAFIKAMVLYIADGYKWDRANDGFIRWTERDDLWCKMKFFGPGIEQANAETNFDMKKRGPKNLLDELPDSFSSDDAVNIRRKNGLDASLTTHMLSVWKKRGYISSDVSEPDVFKKSDKYLKITQSQISNLS